MTTSTATLPRSTPEAQGIPSAAVTAFLAAVEQHELRPAQLDAAAAWSRGGRRLVVALYAGRAAHALFPEQELHFDRDRPGRGRGPPVGG